MLDELDKPAFVEVIEKSSNVCVKNVAHLLVSQRVRQRVQRLMLASPRAETIRETEKVFLVYLIEDGDHGLLDDLVLQRRNPQWPLPPIGLLDVNPSRWLGPVSAAMHPAVQVNQVFLQIGLILPPDYAIDPGCGSSLEGIKSFP